MSSPVASAAAVDGQTAYEIGVEAYAFLFPLVLMDVTRRQMTNVEGPGEVVARAPVDTFAHASAFPPAGFRDVVRPNFDTLYSVAWLDVREEPRIVSVPATKLYYLLPLLDMWTDVFASPGTRTTGSGAIDFAVCPPGWQGELPAGVHRYGSPTSFAWAIGRTQASLRTYDQVHAFQAGMTITPLSAWGQVPSVARGTVDPAVDDRTPPPRQVLAMRAETFFGYAAELMKEHPVHADDHPILDRLARIGLAAGESFDVTELGQGVKDALERAVPAGQKVIAAQRTRLGRQVNGWEISTSDIGTYGTDYLIRAAIALIGLGANVPADAVYPLVYVDGDGKPFHGSERYVWHLEEHQLPPAKAFWSLTLYDAEGFVVANELDRYAIGDRDELRFNADGSLDIVIQRARPESGASNWLPAPDGAFNLAARLYYPEAEVLSGAWVPAAVTRVS